MNISVDIEADGPVPGLYSMIELGAVVIEPELNKTFYACLAPLGGAGFDQAALDVTGHSREETFAWPHPEIGIKNFVQWVDNLRGGRRAFFWSDNPGFDFPFINYYCHLFGLDNPFGHSSCHIGWLWKGIKADIRANFKHLRKTAHTHNPVDDAMGNAEAVLAIGEQFKVKGLPKHAAPWGLENV